VSAVKAVRGDRGGVHDPFDARRYGRLEHVARTVEVDLAALLRPAHDHEGEMHHHVGLLHELGHGATIEHVAAPVGDLLPTPLSRVEGPARHAEYLRDLGCPLERPHDGLADLPRGAGDRDLEARGLCSA
jgi:hypothetical protein